MNPQIKQLLKNDDIANQKIGIYLALNEGHQEEEIFDECFEQSTNTSTYSVIRKYELILIYNAECNRITVWSRRNYKLQYNIPDNSSTLQLIEIAIDVKKIAVNLLIDREYHSIYFQRVK